MKNETDNKKVAVLYICTGEYNIFWKLFYYTFNQRFLKNSDVHYYVFTDAENLEYRTNKDVHIIKVKAEKWPYSTLKRFHYFLMVETELREYDFCFFFNANMLCVENISEDEFLPVKDDILVVEHPEYCKQCIENGVGEAKRKLTYERNDKSKACIPYGKEPPYVFGAINGGKAYAYLDLAKELAALIDDDLTRDIVAVFHDESHLNRYIVDHNHYCLKSPEYAYPDGWILPYEQKIMVMQKENIIDVTSIREGSKDSSYDKVYAETRRAIKMNQFFEVSRQLLKAKSNGLNLPEYMKSKGLINIVIYGFRNWGEILLDEIRGSGIKVECIIDNFCSPEKVSGYRLIRKEDVKTIKKADAIIVTAMPSFYLIMRDLIDYTEIPIYSIEHIIHEMYLKTLGEFGRELYVYD